MEGIALIHVISFWMYKFSSIFYSLFYFLNRREFNGMYDDNVYLEFHYENRRQMFGAKYQKVIPILS